MTLMNKHGNRLQRRDFLKAGATMSAAFIAAPTSAKTSNDQTMVPGQMKLW